MRIQIVVFAIPSFEKGERAHSPWFSLKAASVVRQSRGPERIDKYSGVHSSRKRSKNCGLDPRSILVLAFNHIY
jgi:hypothetical protein